MPWSRDAFVTALAATGVVSISIQACFRSTDRMGRAHDLRGDLRLHASIYAAWLYITFSICTSNFQALQLWSKWRRGGLQVSLAAWPGAQQSEVADGVEGLIGKTPLVRIRSLSDATGCEVSGAHSLPAPLQGRHACMHARQVAAYLSVRASRALGRAHRAQATAM